MSSSALRYGVVAAVALGGLAAPAAAQRGYDQSRFLMSSFGGAERELRVKATDEVRSRLDDAYGRRELWVISKREIAGLLEDSGFPLDTALAPFEMRQLGRRQRADEFLDG